MSILDRVNPVTPFLAAFLYSLPLLITIDLVSATTALVISVSLLLIARITPRQIIRRSWPIFIAAPLSAISMLLYARPEGQIYARFWLAVISDGSIDRASAIAVRVLALGIPTLTILFGIDPTRLGDGLAQVLRLPARFVLATLAGIRLIAVFRDDWDSLAAARRARGLGDRGRIRRGIGMAFTLLVLAVRRGGRLATAMEARGFGRGERTWARPSTLGRWDAVLLVLAVTIGVGSVVLAAVTGALHIVGSGG